VTTARLDQIVSVRFASDELAELRELAGERGVSQLVREAVLAYLAGERDHRLARSSSDVYWTVGTQTTISEPVTTGSKSFLHWLVQPERDRVDARG
jgi:hypothetical protein